MEIFLTNNPVTFLLADLYHTFHIRHKKRWGTSLCCAPLLHLWMRTHMPQRGPFAYSNLSWPQRLTSFSINSILWYKREWETKGAIFRCGRLPNVPIIGTYGWINYNLVPLKKHLGYVMLSPPEYRDLIPFVINNMDPLNSAVKRMKKSWTSIVLIDQEWGKKNILAKEPYFVWVKERGRVVKMPFLYDSS